MHEECVFSDVFCLPHRGKFLLYLPLRNLILLVNDRFVNVLFKARSGDRNALQTLNIDKELLNELLESEERLKYLKRSQNIPPFAPRQVSLFLTYKCTLRCRYCYADGGARQGDMPWDVITGVLQRISENVGSNSPRRTAVHFHGGGDVSAAWPLLVKTREYIDALFSGRRIAVQTSVGLNGILDGDQRKWIAEHIGSATVSLDGVPDVQNRQRPFPDGSPSFEYVDESLKHFDRMKYNYGIRMTVTAESVDLLPESIQFICENYRSKRIKAEPMYPRGRACTFQLKSPDAVQFVTQFKKARRIALSYGRELIYSGARLEILTNIFCQAAGHSCAVTPDGWITSCYEVLDPCDPLSELFFYGRFDAPSGQFIIDEKRRETLFGLSVLEKSFCASCFCKWHCAGDCPVKAIHTGHEGGRNLPDRCYINQELTKMQLIEALES